MFIRLAQMCIVDVYLVFAFFLNYKEDKELCGEITVEYMGEYQRGILEGNMNSLLYRCFPSLCMIPHSLIESATTLLDS